MDCISSPLDDVVDPMKFKALMCGFLQLPPDTSDEDLRTAMDECGGTLLMRYEARIQLIGANGEHHDNGDASRTAGWPSSERAALTKFAIERRRRRGNASTA